MNNPETVIFLGRIKQRLEYLYGDRAEQCVNRLQMMIGRYGVVPNPEMTAPQWTEKDSILITYGDSIKKTGEHPLQTLHNFVKNQVGDAVSGVHILPFFPYSSDDGFSVIDYRKVREDLGGWWLVKEMADDYRLMADLVINHVSQKSTWFKDFKKGIAPASKFFVEESPETDLSAVTRPRKSPLLTPVQTESTVKHVWTTFSADQIDLNFANPDVLFEFLDIILFYISKGIEVIRLDAIAYLWKKAGTNCIHLPETHEVVKLIRDVLDLVAPHVTIITETNVPHEENISYFGHGDEAHMIYQFSLPPLLLHALFTGSSEYLTSWALHLRPPNSGCYYFNFLSSHDGVGVRPLEGLVPDEEFHAFVESIPDKGGFVSKKKNSDGTESPYELNITYFSALADAKESTVDLQVDRFLCAHTIMFALQGIPGVYIHSMTGTSNDLDGVEQKGHSRAINRKQWELNELEDLLGDDSSKNARVFKGMKKLLTIRSQQKAFHPEASQRVISVDPAFFILLRKSNDGSQTILSISNVTDKEQELKREIPSLPFLSFKAYENLLGDSPEADEESLMLQPYETAWLVL